MEKRYRPESTRQTILESAFAEIYRNGFRATSLKQILATTGLTKGALYHHFPNKRALGEALIDELLEAEVLARFVEPLAEWKNPIDGLISIFALAFDSLSEEEINHGCPVNNLALELAPVEPDLQQQIERIYTRWSEDFAAALRLGQQNGSVDPAIDPDDAGTFLVAGLAGSRSLAKSTRSKSRLQACHRGLVRYLEALRPIP